MNGWMDGWRMRNSPVNCATSPVKIYIHTINPHKSLVNRQYSNNPNIGIIPGNIGIIPGNIGIIPIFVWAEVLYHCILITPPTFPTRM